MFKYWILFCRDQEQVQNKASVTLSPLLFIVILVNNSRARKRISVQIGKEEIQLPWLIGDIIMHIENPNGSTKKQKQKKTQQSILKLKDVSVPKSIAFPNTSNKQSNWNFKKKQKLLK